MSKLLLNIKSNKRTCGRCKYKESHSDWARFPNLYFCKIFGQRLETKTTKLGFLSVYRLKKCLQAEKNHSKNILYCWRNGNDKNKL